MLPEGFLIRPDAADPRWGLISLVAANAAVAMAVLLGWLDLREVLLTYWAETGVIGGWALWRMVRLGGLWAIPLAGFFSLHFGGFMFVHLIFLGALTRADFAQAEWHGSSSELSGKAAGTSGGLGAVLSDALRDVSWWAVALLIVGHGIESTRKLSRERALRDKALAAVERGASEEYAAEMENVPEPLRPWVTKGATRAAIDGPATMPMGGVYGRVMVMHVTLLAGAFVAAWLGTPAWLVAVLVVLKTLVDVGVSAGRKTAAAESD